MTEFRLSWLGGLTARRVLASWGVVGILWALIEVQLGGMLQQPYNPIEVVWWRYAVRPFLACARCCLTRRQAMLHTKGPVLTWLLASAVLPSRIEGKSPA